MVDDSNISEKERQRRLKISLSMKEYIKKKREKGYRAWLRRLRTQIKKRKAKEAKQKEREKLKKQKEREKKRHKKKIGRPKKRGPKRKYWRKKKVVKIVKEKKVPLPFAYKIILCRNGVQSNFIGKYKTSEAAYEKFNELKQENEKVIFPALLIGLNGKHEIENLIEEYLLIEQNDDENSLLRNEYGKLVEQKLNISGWTVLDKFRRIKEEDFYVYGYHPRWGRKTFQWIYDNIVTSNINSKYDFKRVCMLLNKIVIKDDNNNMNLIICKSDSDAARFYNLLEQWVKKNKEKQILMVGDYTPVGSRRKKLEEEIMALTGWPIKKVQMRFTTFYKSEKNKKKKLNEEKANNNETNVEHDESIEQDI